MKRIVISNVNVELNGDYNIEGLNLREEHQITMVSARTPLEFALAAYSQDAAFKVAVAIVALSRHDKDVQGVVDLLWDQPSANLTIFGEVDQVPLAQEPGDVENDE